MAAVPASDLLHRLEAIGVELSRVGGYLAAEPASLLSDADRELIRTHKAALLEILAPSRIVLEFRFVDDEGGWNVMLGAPGESLESAIAACRRQFSRPIEVRRR